MSKRILVTDDRWIKLKGRLDPDDEAVMKEAAGGAELVVMNIKETLETIKATSPGKFEQFHKEMEKQAGIPLTPEQLAEFARAADRRFAQFTKLTEAMTKEQANVVRKLRVEQRCSWRAVARTCYILGMGRWSPASNQIMGMALCQRAAQILGEDYRMEPWN